MVAEALTAASERIPLPRYLSLWTTSDTAVGQRPLATAGPLGWTEVKERMQQIELLQQRVLASAFLERVKEEPFVREVWAAFTPTLDVTVIVSDRNLEEELRLYAMFRDLSAGMSAPTLGDLAVISGPYEPDDDERLYP